MPKWGVPIPTDWARVEPEEKPAPKGGYKLTIKFESEASKQAARDKIEALIFAEFPEAIIS